MTTVELETHALSHVGYVRSDNQDALRSQTAPDGLTQVYAVADGMGGYEHGGVASTLALETFMQTVCGWQAGLQTPNHIEQAIRRGVQDANLRVYQESARRASKMGTTITGVVVSGSRLHIAHVGDSRAYLIRDGQATVLTRDHTAVGDMVRAKIISADKIRHHAQRSVLNRSLGIELFTQPDISRATISSGDVLVLCSDGLWASIEDADIAALSDPRNSAEAISARLVETALNNGSDDNVSAWAICVRHAPESIAEVVKHTRFPNLFRGLLHA